MSAERHAPEVLAAERERFDALVADLRETSEAFTPSVRAVVLAVIDRHAPDA